MNQTTVNTSNGSLAVSASIVENTTPILFIHSDSGRGSQWNGVVSILSETNSVISYDAAGHGASKPNENANYSYSSRADDIRAILDDLQISNVIVVAHSGGVGTALEYAASNSSNVKGIFLVDPATDPRGMPDEVRQGFLAALAGDEGIHALQGYYASIAGSNQSVVDQVLQDAATVTKEARLGVATTLAFWNPQESLDNWQGPISALITIANDNPGALYKLHSKMNVEVSDNEGHWLQIDQPAEVAAAIATFVKFN